MTRSQVIRLVAGRELHERLRSKAFRVSTLVTLVFVLAVAILPGLLSDDGPTTYDVGVFGPRAADLAARLPVVAELDENVAVAVDVRRLAGGAEGRRLVASGDLDAAVGDGQVVVDQELGDRLGFLVQEANRLVAGEAALAGAGVTGEAAGRILLPEPLDVMPLDPETDAEAERRGLVSFSTILLYGQLLGFGYWVASGVVEEKASRVVEILLAKAPPAQLLAGKVIGIGAVGLAQLLGFVVIGLATAAMTGSIELPPATLWVAVQILAWFVLGFAFYSCLFAVGGALASRVEELQSTTAPLSMLAMVSFFAAIVAGNDPGGPVAQVTTFLPPSAPLILPIRIAAGEVSTVAVVASVAIVLLSIVAAMALAARVYARGALQVRGPLRLRNVLRAGNLPA